MPDREREILVSELEEERAAREIITHVATHLGMPCTAEEQDRLPEILGYLGKTLHFGRVFLAAIETVKLCWLYEWTDGLLSSFQTRFDELPFTVDPNEIRASCASSQYLYIDKDSGWEHLPASFRDWFRLTGAVSAIVFFSGWESGSPVVVGFECHGQKQLFTSRYRELLKTISSILYFYYHRMCFDRELRESERFLKMTQAAAGLSCWEIVVGKYKRTFGNCFEEIQESRHIRKESWDHAFDNCLPPYDERLRAVLEDAWRTGEPFVLEVMVRDDEGIERWVEVRAQAKIGEGDNARIYGTTLNIDSRKRIERKLRDVNARLDDLARRDSLTGLLNKREFEKDLHNLCTVFERIKRPLSLIMLDVDFFKIYNDTYGHLAGDDCLRSVGEAISSCLLRDADSAYRYGGEEFAIILPDTNPEGALRVAEKVRKSVQDMGIVHEKSQAEKVVTSSFGVATTDPNSGIKPHELVARADAALYRAKRAGRNRVESSFPLDTD